MLYTIIFYNTIILLSSALLYIAEYEKSKIGRTICLWLAFLITTIPSAIRYEIGSDYPAYVRLYEEAIYGGDLSRIEVGFKLLLNTIASLGLSFEWLFAIIAIIIHFFVFLSYPKKNRYLAHLIFMYLFYLDSMVILRQMIGIAIVMYAAQRYTTNKNYFNYSISVIIACLFHTVSIAFLLIPLLINKISEKGIRNFGWLTIVIWLTILLGGSFVITIIDFVLYHSPFEQYLSYLESERYGENNSINFITTLIRAFLYLTPLLFIKKLLRSNPNYMYFVVVYIFYVISWALSANVIIFYRLQQAFGFSLIWLILLIYSEKSIRFSKEFVMVFILALIFMFNTLVMKSHTSYLVTCNSGRYAPYVTIFNKEDSQRGSYDKEILCYF